MTRNGGAPVLPCTEGDVLMSPRPSGFATSTFIGGCCACRPLAQPYVEGGCQGGGDAAAGDGGDRRAARSAVRLILLQSSSAVSRRSIMVLVSTLTSMVLVSTLTAQCCIYIILAGIGGVQGGATVLIVCLQACSALLGPSQSPSQSGRCDARLADK